MNAISILLLCSCIAMIQAIPLALQVTNALIANTDTTAIANNYAQYGITAPPTCSASYPTGFTGNLTICYATTLSFPYRNITGNVGLEVDVTSQWNSKLQAQYAGSSVVFVPITPGATGGLFGAVQTALNNGVCQVALTSLFQTATRDATNAASCAYGITGSDYLVGPAPGSASINGSLFTLNSSSVVIAVGAGSASLNYIQQSISQATNLILTASTGASLTFAANGTANVAIGDAPVLLNYAKNVNPTLCGGNNCPVYQLTPPTSRIVAYALLADPTVAPTNSPTDAPTSAPTNGPTSAPTTTPTAAPTAAPTTRPSTTARTTSDAGVVAFSVAAAAVCAVLML